MEAKWDLFLCHAAEDKDEIAEPLARELQRLGLKVWYDAFSLTPGHSLRRSIEYGLSSSRFGLVVLSEHFFRKQWPQDELDAMFARRAPLIPLWHRVDVDYVTEKSPLLAGLVSIQTSPGVPGIAAQILRRIKDADQHSPPLEVTCTLCVGSSVGEHVFVADNVQIGAKNLASRLELFGGSGYNYACRLLAMGNVVVPILSLGKDRIGERIQSSLVDLLERLPDDKGRRAAEFVRDDEFLCPDLNTIESTIVVSGGARTIFTEEPKNPAVFQQFVEKRLSTLEKHFPDLMIRAVMIGHIYADNRRFNPTTYGLTTKRLIERFKNILLFTNFGESQIKLGRSFWSEAIKDVSIFQLSMSEMRTFFADGHVMSLRETVEQLSHLSDEHRTSAVITLDKFGALVMHRDKPDGVYVVWPHEVPDIVDTTGAGDAFGAGLVASLLRQPADFHGALENARTWAAYACRTPGGAYKCPDPSTLDQFEKELAGWRKEKGLPQAHVEFFQVSRLEPMLWVFDRAY